MATMMSVEEAPAAAETNATLEGFLRAVEQNRTHLLRLAQRITKNGDDAEDIVQEACLKAYRALPNFRGEARVSTWLTAIVRNVALESLRSRRGKVFVSIDSGHEDKEGPAFDFPDTHKSPEEAAQYAELEAILRAEVGRLSWVCKRAIEVCALEQCPLAVAADRLNMSLATVKSGIFRGRRILSERIAGRLQAGRFWKN
jgi:RNA polymerase sigma-70 factor, ECF subfamily